MGYYIGGIYATGEQAKALCELSSGDEENLDFEMRCTKDPLGKWYKGMVLLASLAKGRPWNVNDDSVGQIHREVSTTIVEKPEGPYK